MTSRLARRSVAALAVAATLVTLSGCNMVKAGARCRTGAAPGRDATHVLFCQKGRWTRVMTIGQAADFIISSWPTKVELLEGGGQTTGVGESFGPVVVKVTRKDGSPAVAADVVLDGPAAGASIFGASATARTDANGVARFLPVANGTLGSYAVTVTSGGGYKPYVTLGLNNSAASSSSLVVVSGGGQTAAAGTQFVSPVVVRAVDRFGNTVTNKKVQFSTDAEGVWFGPAEAFAGEDGLASTTMGTGNRSRTVTVTAQVVGASASITFEMYVVAAAIHHGNDTSTGSGQTANASGPGEQFPLRVNNPLNVFLSDVFGNPVVGRAVQYTINPNGGGSGTFDATGTTSATILTEADGIAKAHLHDNGNRQTFTVTATVDGATFNFTVNPPG